VRFRTKTLLVALALALLAWVGVALAQALPPDVDPGKPATWFITAAGWGGMVILIVNFLKANVFKGLHGAGTIIVSALLSVGGALLAGTGALAFLGVSLEGTLPELLSFGVTAFMASSGGWDTLTRVKAAPGGVQAVVDVTANPAANRAANSMAQKQAKP